jgi:flagellar assembly factor FliW
MKFVSKHFGTIDVDEQSVIEFPQGLPGFEDRRRFLPLQMPAQPGLIFLQSLELAELCFLALAVHSVRPDYELEITAEDLETLGLPAGQQPRIGQDVIALAILLLEEGRDPSVNLRSPIVIHMNTRRALQAIRPDERYGYDEALVAPQPEAVCS